MQLYLRYLRPLVSADQWHEAKNQIERFCEDPNKGPLLQRLLERKAEQTDNWVIGNCIPVSLC